MSTAQSKTDVTTEAELQLENSPCRQQPCGSGPQEDMSRERQADCELDEPLSLLASVALAPPRGDHAVCRCECETLQSMQLQLQFLVSKADDLHNSLVNGQAHLDREALAAAVLSFLYTCQPYFNHLESTARSTESQYSHLSHDSCTRLLDFSQQLCDRLEQLVLIYASHNLLCLDETEPNSVSPFCIGQIQLGHLRLTAFRYCKPTPYLARFDTGLYKRMRWNVEMVGDEQQQQQEAEEELGGESEETETEAVRDTEYYFLCYEDIPNVYETADADSQGVTMVRMWSIGQWMQVTPDPVTEDIYDWLMCEVPQGQYHRLLFLGTDEPSTCVATDYLQQLLLSHQTTE